MPSPKSKKNTAAEQADNPVLAFLKGRGKIAPTEKLAADVIAAEGRLSVANERFSEAALAAASGDGAALTAAKAEVSAATDSVMAAKAALARAESLAAQRSAEEAASETARRWKTTEELAEQREKLAADLSQYASWLGDTMRDFKAVTRQLATVAPIRLDTAGHGPAVVAAFAIDAAIQTELTRVGVLPAQKSPFAKTAEPLVDKIKRGTAYIKRRADGGEGA